MNTGFLSADSEHGYPGAEKMTVPAGFALEDTDPGPDHAALIDDPVDTHWSVPWSDLMMTMFVLFAVMFMYAGAKRDFIQEVGADVKNAPSAGQVDAETPGLEIQRPEPGKVPHFGPYTAYEVTRSVIGPEDLKIVSVDVEQGRTVRISLHGPMLFNRMSAELDDRALTILAELGKIIKKTNLLVHVIGHTDSFPVHSDRFDTNWDLSTARANAVARVLMDRAGIEPQRIIVSGRGMYEPLLPNTTEANKARNRRVEIVLYREGFELYRED